MTREQVRFGQHVMAALLGISDHDVPAPNAAELATANRGDPDHMTDDDWEELYLMCESNGEGQPRSVVRYAYEAGWRAARGVK